MLVYRYSFKPSGHSSGEALELLRQSPRYFVDVPVEHYLDTTRFHTHLSIVFTCAYDYFVAHSPEAILWLQLNATGTFTVLDRIPWQKGNFRRC